jgi:hypothetical protein
MLITMTDITPKKSKKKYPTLCIRLNTSLRSHLDNAALVHGITRGEFVRRILSEHFSNPTFVTRDRDSRGSRIPAGAPNAGQFTETPNYTLSKAVRIHEMRHDIQQGPSGPFTDLSLFAKGANGPAGPFTDLFSTEKGFTQQGTTGP